MLRWFPQAKPQGAHPDAEDADGQGLDRRADAGRGAGAQGQCVRDRPEASALDRRAAQWRRPRRRGQSGRRTGQDRVQLRDAGDDAARRRAWRQRQPHHAAARRRWRRRRRNARDLHGGAEPAVRHGAAGRHVLCRQHRRRGGLPLRGGRRPHHRAGARNSSASSPAGTGRGACCRAPTAGSSMPGSARSAISPTTAWPPRKAGPPSTSSIWPSGTQPHLRRRPAQRGGPGMGAADRRALDRRQRARRPRRRDAARLSDLGAGRRLLRLALLLLGPDGGRPGAAGSGRWSPRRSRRTTRWAGTPRRWACAGCRPARCPAFRTAWPSASTAPGIAAR